MSSGSADGGNMLLAAVQAQSGKMNVADGDKQAERQNKAHDKVVKKCHCGILLLIFGIL